MDNIYELNGVTYKFNTMPPSSALPLMTKLGNVLGGLGNIELGGNADSGVDGQEKAGIDTGVLNGIIGLLKSLNHNDLMHIVNECMPWISVDGEKCIMDKAFAGKLLDMFKVIGNFLRFTFGDFFPESVADLIKSKMPAM